MLSVSSVDPLSESTSSKPGYVWASSESSASPRVRAPLYTGSPIVTSGAVVCIGALHSGQRRDVGGVELDRRRLADQMDADHDASVPILANQDGPDALQWAPNDLHRHPLLEVGVRVDGKTAVEDLADGADFRVGDGRDFSVHSQDLDDADRRHHGPPFLEPTV